jgi:hypothetical protein
MVKLLKNVIISWEKHLSNLCFMSVPGFSQFLTDRTIHHWLGKVLGYVLQPVRMGGWGKGIMLEALAFFSPTCAWWRIRESNKCIQMIVIHSYNCMAQWILESLHEIN